MVESHQKRVERIKELEAEVARLKEDGSEAQRMYYQLKRDVQSSVQKPDDDIIPEDYYIK